MSQQTTSPDAAQKWTEIELLPEWDEEYYDVYTAKKHGKWVMLKTLKEPYRNDPRFRSMIEKEFDVRYNLAHPSIVMINDFEVVPGLGLCIITDDVYGLSLRKRLYCRDVRPDDADCRDGSSIRASSMTGLPIPMQDPNRDPSPTREPMQDPIRLPSPNRDPNPTTDPRPSRDCTRSSSTSWSPSASCNSNRGNSRRNRDRNSRSPSSPRGY